MKKPNYIKSKLLDSLITDYINVYQQKERTQFEEGQLYVLSQLFKDSEYVESLAIRTAAKREGES